MHVPRKMILTALVLLVSPWCDWSGKALHAQAPRSAAPPGGPQRAVQPARPPGIVPHQSRGDTPGHEEQADNLYELISSIVIDNLPDKYEDKRHWGMKKEVWRGVRLSGKPFELKMNSRKREVNHGTWRMYQITLVEPDRWFRTRLANVGGTGAGQLGFDVIINARIHCFARLSQWESGVQLISLSTEAEADVRLRLRCEAGVRFDFANILPAATIEPKVTAADLRLIRFRVLRISRLDGPLAHELGKGLRGVLENKIESKRHKMVAKINRQIDKNKDKLRLSIADLGRRAWDELADVAGLD
jgi:hypothetical protein